TAAGIGAQPGEEKETGKAAPRTLVLLIPEDRLDTFALALADVRPRKGAGQDARAREYARNAEEVLKAAAKEGRLAAELVVPEKDRGKKLAGPAGRKYVLLVITLAEPPVTVPAAGE
ncbi:MAG: hypothetical protein ACYTGB_15855, partial [Planctomycetota bacterium]